MVPLVTDQPVMAPAVGVPAASVSKPPPVKLPFSKLPLLTPPPASAATGKAIAATTATIAPPKNRLFIAYLSRSQTAQNPLVALDVAIVGITRDIGADPLNGKLDLAQRALSLDHRA